MQSQIQAEVRGVLDMLESVYGVFGFKYSLMLSTRPEKYLGEVEQWNQAEKALEESLNAFVADKNQQDQLKWQAQQPAQTLPPSATTADLPSSSSSSSSSSSPPASSSDASASTPPAKQAAFKPMKWALNPGDGAFYGPKIDIQLTDALGRRHQWYTPLTTPMHVPARRRCRSLPVTHSGCVLLCWPALVRPSSWTSSCPSASGCRTRRRRGRRSVR